MSKTSTTAPEPPADTTPDTSQEAVTNPSPLQALSSEELLPHETTLTPAAERRLILATLAAGYVSGRLAQCKSYASACVNPDEALQAVQPLADAILQ